MTSRKKLKIKYNIMAWDKEFVGFFFSQGWNFFPHLPCPQHHVYICLMVSGFLKWLILKQFGPDFIIMAALPFLTKSHWEQQILDIYTKQSRVFQADYPFTYNKASVDFSKCWSRSQIKKKKVEKVGEKIRGRREKKKEKEKPSYCVHAPLCTEYCGQK